jgi:hypothetical protein
MDFGKQRYSDEGVYRGKCKYESLLEEFVWTCSYCEEA